MPKLEADLEKEWQQWKKARAKGLVDGDFSHAKELLKHRKARGGTVLHGIPLHLGAGNESKHWPPRPKGRKTRRK